MKTDSFFGRQNYLEILHKRVNGLKQGYRQNIAITGDELAGKTSIIFKFLETFCDNQLLILYLEVRPESAFSFAKRFIGVLLYNFLSNSGMPLEEDVDFLVNKSERFAPKTVERIRYILSLCNKRKKESLITELFTLTESLFQETGKHSVIILDEFNNLEHLGFKNPYKEWSKLLVTQKNTLYIIISSMKYRAKAILSKELSLLFGNFELVTVEPFDVRSSEQFLESRFEGVHINTGLKDFIIHFTGGFPLYLKIIADALKGSTADKLPEILESLLFDAHGVLNQRYSNYIKRFLDYPNSNDFISILYLVACGRNKIREMAHILRKQRKELLLRVNKLLELDAVSRSGDFLKINDRVFGFWLGLVYQEKLQSLTFDAKYQKLRFRDRIEGMVREFTASTQRPLIERLSELLHLFEDETIQVERKKVRLRHFREIKTLEFKRCDLKYGLIARSSEGTWIMAVKDAHLTEEDILEFSKECRKYRQKLEKKIIIALEDIDTNTRLRAMEEKIWTWDINNLNQIFDLFAKPCVII
ncbi:MAG: hypothetical protein AB1481_05845 [Candidatus Omnitrophota bacterium]